MGAGSISKYMRELKKFYKMKQDLIKKLAEVFPQILNFQNIVGLTWWAS